GVGDVQAAVAVQHDAMRQVELAGFGPLASHAAQIPAVVRELLHAVVGRADPDATLAVDAHADRTAHDGRGILVHWRRAKSSGLNRLIAPVGQQLSLGRELLHAIEGRVGGVHIARGVEGDELRPGETTSDPLVAAKLARLFAERSPLAYEFPL